MLTGCCNRQRQKLKDEYKTLFGEVCINLCANDAVARSDLKIEEKLGLNVIPASIGHMHM